MEEMPAPYTGGAARVRARAWSWRTCLGSFHAEPAEAVRNAIRFVKEAA